MDFRLSDKNRASDVLYGYTAVLRVVQNSTQKLRISYKKGLRVAYWLPAPPGVGLRVAGGGSRYTLYTVEYKKNIKN